MTQIYIDGNDIKRQLGIEFDVDAPISYNEFIQDPVYSNIFDDMLDKSNAIDPLTIQILFQQYSKWISKHIYRKILLLSQYDIIEVFENGLSYDRQLEHDTPSGLWFYDNIFNKEIDIMKHHLTKNHVIKEGIIKPIKLLDPETLWRLQHGGDNDLYIETKKKTKKNIQLQQTMKSHRKIQYIILMGLISDRAFYLVSKEDNSNIIITSAKNITNHINYTSIVFELENLQKYIEDGELIEKIEFLKQEYRNQKDNEELVLEDLKDFLTNIKSGQISIRKKEGELTYGEISFQDNNLDKYDQYDEYVGGYGDIGFGKHNGIKQSIKGKKSLKYKKKDGLNNDKSI